MAGYLSTPPRPIHEFTADTQLVAANTSGVIVAVWIGSAGSLELYDGTSAAGTKIMAVTFVIASDWVVFPPGFQPRFTNGLFADVTGTTPPCKVLTA